FLKDWVSEKLAAVKDSNGTGFWVIAHGFHQPEATTPNPAENNKFYAYHVVPGTNGTNLVGTEVISSVGKAHQSSTTGTYQPSSGQMKISPDGQWIACAVHSGFVEVLSFNTATGQVTQPNPAKVFLP